MGGKTTVSRIDLPQNWPRGLSDFGVKLHTGVREDELGDPMNVFSPEVTIPFAAVSESEHYELANHIAGVLCGEEAWASMNTEQGYATVSVEGTGVEIHLDDGEIAIRGAREFCSVPDGECIEVAHYAIDDAEAVSIVATLAQDFLREPKRLRRMRYIGYA